MNRANRLAALEQATHGIKTIYTLIASWEWPDQDMLNARKMFEIEHGDIPETNTVVFIGFGPQLSA